jgi:aspartate carbamoyltransferase catalytic subunit
MQSATAAEHQPHDQTHAATTAASEAAGHEVHDKHAGHDPEMFRRRFWLALLFTGAVKRITLISEMADPIGFDLNAPLEESTIPVSITNDAQEVLPDLDVIYVNSIAFLGDSYRRLDSRYKLNANSPLKPQAAILHPLARRDELAVELDDTDHNLYFAQAAGAVFLRQAVLTTVLDRVSRVTTI